MPNPQQPELRRSERVPALDPDATEARLSAERRERKRLAESPVDPGGPVPREQRRGHHPDEDQDKPDMDAFAERLGVVSDDEEPADAPRVEEERPRAGARRPGWSPIGLALVVPVTGFMAARAALRALRRVADSDR